jgi:SRSO17 transposase
VAVYWLLCEQAADSGNASRFYLSNLPESCSLTRLVRLAHQRWAIEQQYSDLKTELGLDHFEGRTYPGWQHHVAVSAVAHAFLQRERMRRRAGPTLTFPQIRAIVQEVFVGLLYISRPKYLAWLNAGQRHLQLRI